MEEHLQAVLEHALTGLEMDQSGNTIAAQLAYQSALSCMAYVTDNLISQNDPLVWLEACCQVQSVLADRIQARRSTVEVPVHGPQPERFWEPYRYREGAALHAQPR